MHGSMSLALTGCTFSFSGGKDSTVLLHIARQMYPEMKAVFIDTSLEYPEIIQFVKTFDNVDWLRPKMGFKQVCEKYGFPLISKEVSECVYGARKYLTSIMAEMNASTNERTNERHPYRYWYDKVTGQGKYKKKEITLNDVANNIPIEEMHFCTRDVQNLMGWRRKNKGLHEPFVDNIALTNPSGRGGYDNKYRKLRGIGEYAKQEQVERTDSKDGNPIRDADERQSDKGEYP